ncbi:MAG: NUDIX hydrolase [Erysipelotrichaceae bacterium]
METKIKSELKFNGRIIQVYQDEVEVNHKQALRDVVIHPGGSAILVVKDEQLLLVKQYRYVIGKALYEIPAGKLDAGELPIICAKRELEEETGYTCESLNEITKLYSSPGIFNEQITIFEAINIHKVDNPLAMDEDEDISLHWFSIDEIKKMIINNEINDAKTLCAIQYYLLKK